MKKPPVKSLSPRQLQVLSILAVGKTRKEAALELGISEFTLNNYANGIIDRLGAHNMTEALANAVRCGFISSGGLMVYG
jgi:DNA-binding NarL/FixJ family response regulator